MTSSKVQQELVQFIQDQGFNAPYGVLTRPGTSVSGRRFQGITFGRPRTLDAEIQIFGPDFIILRHSRDRYNSHVFRSVDEVKQALTSL